MEIMLSTDPVVEKYLKMALESEEVPFEYYYFSEVTITNLKSFYSFLENNLKNGFTFDKVIQEMIGKSYEQSGPSCIYELGSYETKSGNPETIYFEVYIDYNEEEGEINNYTIIF